MIDGIRKYRISWRTICPLALVAIISIWIQGCAPEHYRPRPSFSTASRPEIAAPAKTQQPAEPRPTLDRGTIREEDLKERGSSSAGRIKDPPSPERQTPAAPPVADDSSLMAKITPNTSPHRAASIRLTEEGRRLIESGDYDRAVNRLEKTITIDSTNGYGYYYLAQAHHRMAHYQESLNFLEVAESLFNGQSYWLAEVFALRGDNYYALGVVHRADASYNGALRWNPANRVALEGVTRLRGESPSNR